MTYALCYYSIPASVSLFNRELNKQRADEISSFVRPYIKNGDAELLNVHQYYGELEVEERNSDAPALTLLVVSIELDLETIENWKENQDLIADRVYAVLKSDGLPLCNFSEDEEDGTLIVFTKCYD